MQKTKYLIRLDDACPYMDSKKWQRIEDILDKYGVKPLVGIIPANADPKTMIEPEDPGFWKKARSWEKKGWQIALHGYDHVCISKEGMKGLNPFWERSEFAGLPLEQQKRKISNGIKILREHDVKPKFFFAPSHTFDENTLKALELESDIRIISDTIALRPYKKGNFTFIPQISGHCVKMPLSGIYTFCFHPNTMKDKDFNALECFLEKYNSFFSTFEDVHIMASKNNSFIDRLMKFSFFTLRKMKGLR